VSLFRKHYANILARYSSVRAHFVQLEEFESIVSYNMLEKPGDFMTLGCHIDRMHIGPKSYGLNTGNVVHQMKVSIADLWLAEVLPGFNVVEFFNGHNTDKAHPFIEDCIAKQQPLVKVIFSLYGVSYISRCCFTSQAYVTYDFMNIICVTCFL